MDHDESSARKNLIQNIEPNLQNSWVFKVTWLLIEIQNHGSQEGMGLGLTKAWVAKVKEAIEGSIVNLMKLLIQGKDK